VIENLLVRARAGDEAAFAKLVEGHRAELQVHCYRMLGSVQDAEDALQETLLAAWRGLVGYQERASLRTWLYTIATSRCLNMRRPRLPRQRAERPTWEPPPPSRRGEVLWLEPYPDTLLETVPDSAPGPETRLESTEAISLAFVTAVQLLSPRQRAVLLLRDVLGFRAAEVAEMLDTTHESVTSALKRARATVEARPHPGATSVPPPDSPAERELVGELTRAFQAADVDGLVALLTRDVVVSMPPLPLEYHGREPAARFFREVAFRPGMAYRFLPTRANRQPALGVYLEDPQAALAHANGLLVATVRDTGISAITRFDASVLPRFGLPRLLPA
jgi:RNA polymerase sigma-70 factor, ECF subfamily